jgi:hypothetical protein
VHQKNCHIEKTIAILFDIKDGIYSPNTLSDILAGCRKDSRISGRINACPSQIFVHVDTIAFQAFPD